MRATLKILVRLNRIGIGYKLKLDFKTEGEKVLFTAHLFLLRRA